MDLEEAQKLWERYQQGRCHSWISKVTGLPSSVAIYIGKFVSPPSNFFLEPGDLVLKIPGDFKYGKHLVFRKAAQ